MTRKRFFVMVCLFFFLSTISIANCIKIEPQKKSSPTRRRRKLKKNCSSQTYFVFKNFLRDIVQDVIQLNNNLLTWDSFKIISSIFPVYIATRMADEKLQNCFYDELCHKNKMQLPYWCHDIAQFSIAIPIIYFGSLPLWATNREFQEAGRIFLLGFPFVIFSKDIIKKFDFDACLRPWNEHFSKQRRSSGGFPSGHMAEAAYMAVLFGMRFGPRYAIPLGVLAAFIGATFLNCNRHYASQLVAGVCFGSLYGIAANKLIDKKLSEYMNLTITFQDRKPGLFFQISF